jgi:hypothetical protein
VDVLWGQGEKKLTRKMKETMKFQVGKTKYTENMAWRNMSSIIRIKK